MFTAGICEFSGILSGTSTISGTEVCNIEALGQMFSMTGTFEMERQF